MPVKQPTGPSLLAVLLTRGRACLAYLLFHAQGRVLFMVLLLAGLIAGGTYVGWRRYGPALVAGADYQLRPADIELIPPPAAAPWIRRDVKAEVVRDASLDRPLSILDEELVQRVAQAFQLHPWVERVERVTKTYPARVSVHLKYRRPVAVVVVEAQSWWPVDAAAYVLPPDDFSPLESRAYAQLHGVASPPPGPVGSRWPDARVQGGAAIAAALGEQWTKLRLSRIHVHRVPSSVDRDDAYEYELWTQKNTKIHWGRAAGDLRPDEMSAAEKVALLVQYAQMNGSLDDPSDVKSDRLRTGESHELDLRYRGKPLAVPITASRDATPPGVR
jgi:hypothetical protein